MGDELSYKSPNPQIYYCLLQFEIAHSKYCQLFSQDFGRRCRVCKPLAFACPTMTVNHVFVRVSHVKMPAMRAFYRSVLKPLGYSELITVSENYIGFGSDYPYLWLKVLPEGKESVPTHIALDAPGMST